MASPNQVVIEPYLDDKKQLQWRVLPADPGPRATSAEIMKAQQGGMAGVFQDLMPVVGGGALAAFSGAAADKLLGGLGGGIVGTLGKAVPRVAAAFAIHQFAPKGWRPATQYAIHFLLYDAVKAIVDIDGIARGFAGQITGGLNLAGLGKPPADPAATGQAQTGDPLLAGWT